VDSSKESCSGITEDSDDKKVKAGSPLARTAANIEQILGSYSPEPSSFERIGILTNMTWKSDLGVLPEWLLMANLSEYIDNENHTKVKVRGFRELCFSCIPLLGEVYTCDRTNGHQS
jgi:hypothetical protein